MNVLMLLGSRAHAQRQPPRTILTGDKRGCQAVDKLLVPGRTGVAEHLPSIAFQVGYLASRRFAASTRRRCSSVSS